MDTKVFDFSLSSEILELINSIESELNCEIEFREDSFTVEDANAEYVNGN